jgi:hypothetical protein
VPRFGLHVIDDLKRRPGLKLFGDAARSAAGIVVDDHHLIRQSGLPRQIFEHGAQTIIAPKGGNANADLGWYGHNDARHG